jgi:outer membrane protein
VSVSVRTVCRGVAALAWCVMASVPAAAQTSSAPLTLQAAIRRAIEEYPALQSSAARVAAQEANVALARTAYLPRLDSSIQINRATRNNVAGLLLPGTNVPPISGPVSDNASASSIWGSAGALVLSWEAFDFGARDASLAHARSLVARATAAETLTRLDVGLRAAEAFLLVAAAQETVRAARANVERQDVFAQSVSALVKNELRPGAEESRARAELAQARIQLIEAEQAEEASRARLAQWVGGTASDVQIQADPLLAASPDPAPTPAASPEVHPLAGSQRAAVESTRALREAIGKSFAPKLNVQTAYSMRGTGTSATGASLGGGQGLDFDTPNWAVGLTATFPLFDWFAVRERTRVESHNERAERAAYDRIVRELSAQAEQARAEMTGARRVAENTPVRLEAARVLEAQSRARYDAGLATIIEVTDAQRLLLDAEVGDALARLAVWRARLSEAAARGDLSELLK